MNPDSPVVALVLTKNEQLHLRRCLESAAPYVRSVLVVDSFSDDGTPTLAAALGAAVVQHPWTNYSSQFNWGLAQLPSDTQWVIRLDADEIVTPALGDNLLATLPDTPDAIAGYTVVRRMQFMGRTLRYGGMYPLRMLRVFRYSRGRCEARWMDEHILVDGGIRTLAGDLIDSNLNGITWWTAKHNSYATREAIDILMPATDDRVLSPGRQARARRLLKGSLYLRAPLGLRVIAYTSYRYFGLFGFLDGWPGFVFHALQAFWYRLLVDVKVHEIQHHMAANGVGAPEAIRALHGVDAKVEGARTPLSSLAPTRLPVKSKEWL